MAEKSEARRFIAFLWTGGIAAMVNVASRALLSMFVEYQLAVLLAYMIGMLTAYALSRWFVFEASGNPVAEELVKFAMVNIIAAAQVWAVSMIFNFYLLPMINWTFERELLAHLIGVASPIATSYFGHKHFSFGTKTKHTTGE